MVYMQFLKAHYEKVILSIVLVGLAALAALMPLRVAQERERQDAREGTCSALARHPGRDLIRVRAPLACVSRFSP